MTDASEITELADGIIRLRAANSGPMTGTGTNTYILSGPDGKVVIDPGPRTAPHLSAIMAAIGQTALRAILITHAHLDHTALTPDLVAATAARVMAYGGATSGRSAQMQGLADQLGAGGEGADHSFDPEDLLRDEQTLDLAGLQIKVLHTPGHMGGHLCFGLGDVLFSGDHVMGWSTSLISPPDGDMAVYMAQLKRLTRHHWGQFLPGHGEVITEPAARLAHLIAHRRAREAQLLAALRTDPATAARMAAQLYTDITPTLLPAATRNILAHLIDLHDRNLVTTDGQLTADTLFRAI